MFAVTSLVARSSFARTAAVVLYLASSVGAVATDVTVKLHGTWQNISPTDESGAPSDKTREPVKVVAIQPFKPDGIHIYTDKTIHPNSPVLSNPQLLDVRVTNDNRPVDVKIAAVTKGKQLLFVPVVVMDPKALNQALSITIRDTSDGRPALILVDPAGKPIAYERTFSVAEPTTPTTDMGATRFNLSDFNQNFLSLLGGSTDGAIVSGKLNASLGRLTSFNDVDVFLRGKATADVKVSGSNVAGYFNSVVGELDSFIEHQYDRPIEGAGTEELGLRTRFESDRAFQTINATVGAAYWFTVDNDFTRWLNHFLYRSPDGDKRSLLAPAIVIGYDYVGKVHTGSGESARAVETSEHRLSGQLDWPFEIANGWDLSKTPLKAIYDIDLLVDVTPICDLVKGKFLVEEKISLEIIPATDKNKASVVLTFADGKATPTFKNVNTILAGVKLPF
jgi:hypothetical protein